MMNPSKTWASTTGIRWISPLKYEKSTKLTKTL
jgi:hypothetical protein